MDLLKVIENFNTKELFDFFNRQDILQLHLDENDYEILNKSKFTGTSFCICSQDDLIYNELKYFTALAICELRRKIE